LDWTGSGSNERFYGTNAHHDVTWTADATGAVSNTLRYDPWGTLTNSWGTSLPDFRFQGNWFDSQTSLSWVVTRWYAPALARFISEDSLLGDAATPPSQHLYAYGSGEPVGHWDPDGRVAINFDRVPAGNCGGFPIGKGDGDFQKDRGRISVTARFRWPFPLDTRCLVRIESNRVQLPPKPARATGRLKVIMNGAFAWSFNHDLFALAHAAHEARWSVELWSWGLNTGRHVDWQLAKVWKTCAVWRAAACLPLGVPDGGEVDNQRFVRFHKWSPPPHEKLYLVFNVFIKGAGGGFAFGQTKATAKELTGDIRWELR
jgi:RHS repeat-associated protein